MSAVAAPRGGDEGARVVVVGAGAVGRAAVAELRRLGAPVTAVDRDPARLGLLATDDPGLETLIADAFARDALVTAGVAEARGFISALQPLRDNLFLCTMARRLNPTVPLVARIGNAADAPRFRQLGAAVVNPAELGGGELATRMVLPAMADFVEALIASGDRKEQIARLDIPEGSPLAGKTLGEACLQQCSGSVVLGLRRGGRGAFEYHPSPRARLRAGGAVMALGEPHQLDRLRTMLRGG
ncbi:MAG: TrkA family potassium uptake protein [Deltaproteobacteria bacterium]|nr:TrkA family potassium uptake protein [Deltaproteobacteria bacterium]